MIHKEAEMENNNHGHSSDHALDFIPTSKWVRVYFGGKLVAESRQMRMLRQIVRTPVYYFPKEDVKMEYLLESKHTTQSPLLGNARTWHLKSGEKIAENAAWTYFDSNSEWPLMEGYIAFEFDKMDAWFEEDEQIFIHPRDPYVRIDVLHSSRHIRVVLGNETVAESRHPVILFETGLPPRYYLPKTHVRMDLLLPSDTHTACPYKGIASYYSVNIGGQVYKDIVWVYPFPHPDMAKIQNLVSFYNEKVDAMYIDGQIQAKPKTPWS